jgi:hypothetical protein
MVTSYQWEISSSESGGRTLDRDDAATRNRGWRRIGLSIPAAASFVGLGIGFGVVAILLIGQPSANAVPDAPFRIAGMADVSVGAVAAPAATGQAEPRAAARTQSAEPVVRDGAADPDLPSQPAVGGSDMIGEASVPAADDPRWAKDMAVSRALRAAALMAAAAPVDSATAGGVSALSLGAVTTDGAAEDVGAPEQKTAMIPPPALEKAAAQKPARVAAPTRKDRVNDYVNLRSSPRGKVLTVVPAKAEVGVVECRAWCKIVYEGRTGYVYKDFVGGSPAKASQAKASQAKASQVEAASVPAEQTEDTAEPQEPETNTASFTAPGLGAHGSGR